MVRKNFAVQMSCFVSRGFLFLFDLKSGEMMDCGASVFRPINWRLRASGSSRHAFCLLGIHDTFEAKDN